MEYASASHLLGDHLAPIPQHDWRLGRRASNQKGLDAIVSSFDPFEYCDEAPLFRRLSENFELCVVGLNLIKQDLEEFQRECHDRFKQTVMASTPRQELTNP